MRLVYNPNCLLRNSSSPAAPCTQAQLELSGKHSSSVHSMYLASQQKLYELSQIFAKCCWLESYCTKILVKCPPYRIHVSSIPESQISIHFPLQPAVFEIQAILRQMHQITPKWPWSLQGQRYSMFNCIPESQISLRFALRPAIFKISHILYFPIEYHVKQLKRWKKMPKIKISNSTILLTTLVEALPRSTHERILGNKSDVFLQGRCHLKLLLPYGSMLTKTKKMAKNTIRNFTIPWTTVVETLLSSMHVYWEWIWCVLSEEMAFETFTPIWFHVNKKRKEQLAKIQNLKFHNSLNNFGSDPS